MRKNWIKKLKALRIYAVMCSVFSRKQKYNSEDVVILMTQLSSYLTTKELNDLYETNFMEWCRKRDWFIEHTMKKYKGVEDWKRT